MLYLMTSAVLLFYLLNQGESVTLTLSSQVSHIRASSTITLSCDIHELKDDFFSQDGSIFFFRYGTNSKMEELAYYTPANYTTTSWRYKVSGLERNDRYTVYLQLKDIIEEDATEYQCATYRADNVDRASNEYKLWWIQTAPMNYPDCDAYWQSDKWYLKCTSAVSVPPPNLVWFNNGAEISGNSIPLDGYQVNEISTNLIDVNNTYECRFYYFDGGIDDIRSCRIEKPNIAVISPVKTEFSNGGVAEITVLARASPPMTTPIVCTWDYGDSYDYTVHTDGKELATITVLNIDVSMNGSQITCCGRNFIGVTCNSFFVFVKDSKELSETSHYLTAHSVELIAMGILLSIVILLSVVILFLCKNDMKKSKLSGINPFEAEMRSPSFISTSTDSQCSNADSEVHDASFLRKRSAKVLSSRHLPPLPLYTLSQVLEQDGTTYSVIKTDQSPFPQETNLQPYEDMRGMTKEAKMSPSSNELPPHDSFTAENCSSGFHYDVDKASLIDVIY